MAILTEVAETISLDGGRKSRGNLTKARIRWVIVALLLVFATVGGRLIQLGATVTDSTIDGIERDVITASRPPILDRNGLEMAVDIRVPGVPLARLRDAGLGLRRGGVGYYPASDFVHLDTGRVRRW